MLNQIVEIVNEIRKKYPVIGNELDGKIYYMNGNDGTDFDWECNDRLCEFMVFHENEYGYIKIMVNKNNSVDVYVFANGGMSPTATIKMRYNGNVSNFKNYMMCKFDDNGIWDESIDEFI